MIASDGGVVELRVDLGQQLAFLNGVVEVNVQFSQWSGNERTDLDFENRFDGSRRHDGVADFAFVCLNGSEVDFVTFFVPLLNRLSCGEADAAKDGKEDD